MEPRCYARINVEVGIGPLPGHQRLFVALSRLDVGRRIGADIVLGLF